MSNPLKPYRLLKRESDGMYILECYQDNAEGTCLTEMEMSWEELRDFTVGLVLEVMDKEGEP